MKNRMLRLLAIVSLVFAVGCSGKQRISDLEAELAACNDAKGALETENGDLQEANARLQNAVDEAEKLASARKKLYDQLQAALKSLVDAGNLKITIRNGMIVLQLPNKILFDSGKAELKKEARETLVQVAGALKNVRDRRFFISGHTDSRSVKEKAKKFRDNWELSVQRAYSVYVIVASAGVAGENLAIAGFGHTDPIADNGTEEGMAQNRRTEIMVMPNLEVVLPAMAGK